MLNVCMERRRIREGGLPFAMTRGSSEPHESEEDDAEFYDCSTEDDADKHSDKRATAPWNRPEGRLSRLGEHTLVGAPDEWLYIPVTQEPVPKTEDQLEKDAEVMLQLGANNGERGL